MNTSRRLLCEVIEKVSLLVMFLESFQIYIVFIDIEYFLILDWRKMHTSVENDSIVSKKVKSARNMFKEIESKKENLQKYNRPTSRKVRDPKEIMERRKKMTYGNDNEELPQDGVIKKSVIIEENEMGNKKNALNLYKTLENRNDTYLPSEKPTNRLLTDEEARVTMNGKKMSTSTTTSEGSEDLTIEIHGDVSGYGSANTPCSPLSVVSDDYTCLPDAPGSATSRTLVSCLLHATVNIFLIPLEFLNFGGGGRRGCLKKKIFFNVFNRSPSPVSK